jgi:protein-disulfide isomerase
MTDEKMNPDISKKPKEESETVENIVALSIFLIIILVIIALFTNGFGLFAPKSVNNNNNNPVNTNERVKLAIGDSPIRGNILAPVNIIVFSDFQCPYCKDAESKMNTILARYGDNISYVFKNYPLTQIHQYAYDAALAAQCAKEQGKYWEYHDYLFLHNDQLEKQYLEEYANVFGLKTDQFNTCLESKKYSFVLDQDVRDARAAGVSSTPTFFINGIRVVGDLNEAEYVKVIDAELQIKR